MSKVFALIPARGGSKGMPQKNIAPLADLPMLVYTINAALKSEVVDATYVSSDDDQTLAVAHYYGAERFKRDPHLARDETPIDDVVTEFIHRIKAADKDIIILLPPTSPLRTAIHVREALAEFYDFPTCRGLISVYEINNQLLKAYIGGGEFLSPLAGAHSSYMRRQDLPSLYMPNGAISIFKVEEFMREQMIPRTHEVPYLMSQIDSLDIDTQEDFALAEERLANKRGYG